jgi:hypothetical protein
MTRTGDSDHNHPLTELADGVIRGTARIPGDRGDA